MLRHCGRRDDVSVRRDNIRLLTKPKGFRHVTQLFSTVRVAPVRALLHRPTGRCPIVSAADLGAGFKAKPVAVDGGTVSVTVQVNHFKETKR